MLGVTFDGRNSGGRRHLLLSWLVGRHCACQGLTSKQGGLLSETWLVLRGEQAWSILVLGGSSVVVSVFCDNVVLAHLLIECAQTATQGILDFLLFAFENAVTVLV